MSSRKNFQYGLPGGRAYYRGKDAYASQAFENETRQKIEALDQGQLTVPRMTTDQRDALTAVDGMLIYNTTTAKFQGREAGAWVNLV